ncbi:MAG: tRNA (adenosine(37)-N6)-dimethylallyltransferase MiaA [Rhodospirillaceae bacterium]|nr:MAG: tRNA (adenosine(37)-N6)-dimethylallyltransferase MiaA [Rhodospirillaceae bacterium TMED63]RZO37198.1 MAG: tRNA (adenosine(37)-N6)-dimethylallyltransferase MiaA [Rhodospirillaceae bacterium]
MTGKPVIVVGGPTASGKSGLALQIAQAFDGEIVNADSMQVYSDLKLVTARPDACDEATVPHHLYGILGRGERSSAGTWRKDALDVIAACHTSGKLPILVGGTGLYLRALVTGFHQIPDIPPDIRTRLNRRLETDGPGTLYGELAAVDREMALRLNPADGQRIVRALEVLQHTGRTLSDWQTGEPVSAPGDLRFLTIMTAPPRDDLYNAIDARVERMIGAGAVEEVELFLATDPQPDFPLLKAVGVPPISEFIEGTIDRDRMTELCKRDTRRYAKRQTTWFRHQIISEITINMKLSQKTVGRIFPEISNFLLTP